MRHWALAMLCFLLPGCFTGPPLARYAERYGVAAPGAEVTATFLGCASLAFRDRDEAVMTDGFFTRPGKLAVLFDRPVESDPNVVRTALERIGLARVSAVVPIHSHYDHALDSPVVAAQTGGVVLGSSTTKAIADGLELRNAIVATPGRAYVYPPFTVTLYESKHGPIAEGGPPFPGSLDSPLAMPAPVSHYLEGGSFSVHVEHESAGAVLVHGSAGFVPGALDDVHADAVYLGIGGLSTLEEGEPGYIERYWNEVVVASGAKIVRPIHHDDFTLPFGSERAFPTWIFDDPAIALDALSAMALRDGVRLEMLPMLEPVSFAGP
ncbi:MAG: MBL fold metallo-hydrolase [bacterium]|nr:MBL fold metallo-hydrolase [bacterium]MCP5065904.1 MBL fold metallo-hydrolase [bacterium]